MARRGEGTTNDGDTVRILIDMNLSPYWVFVFERLGWEAMQWVNVGDPTAPDTGIMRWARKKECVVSTHDLDFGAILAATGEKVVALAKS